MTSSSSGGDETYLEAFIEKISSTLPHNMKRDLEHIAALDKSCLSVTSQLQTLETDLIENAEKKVLDILKEKIQKEASTTDDDGSTSSVIASVKNIIPTTEELEYIAWDDKQEEEVQQLRKKARLYSVEKVVTAEHCLELVKSTLSRLNDDISNLETLLKGTGELEAFLNSENGALNSLGQPNDLAAIQEDPNLNDWILAKIISHNPDTGIYKLSDEDTESSKIFHLPQSQVVVLTGMERLAKDDVVYAVYPDTTSFYHATVVQGPRKIHGHGGGSFVLVNFHDDSDENGVTHDKAVLMKHVMRPPFLIG